MYSLISPTARTSADDAAFSLALAGAIAQSRRADDLVAASNWGLARARNLREGMCYIDAVLNDPDMTDTGKLMAIRFIKNSRLMMDDRFIQHKR